jgi:hypothetical protein
MTIRESRNAAPRALGLQSGARAVQFLIRSKKNSRAELPSLSRSWSSHHRQEMKAGGKLNRVNLRVGIERPGSGKGRSYEVNALHSHPR